jgi:hypothetical protein
MDDANLPAPSGDNPVAKLWADIVDDSGTKDFETSRTTILQMIETGKTSIEQLQTIALQSQHPRAYEVLANLIKTTLDASMALMQNQEKVRKLRDADKPVNGPENQKNTVNNNLIVTTKDLGEILKKMTNDGSANTG